MLVFTGLCEEVECTTKKFNEPSEKVRKREEGGGGGVTPRSGSLRLLPMQLLPLWSSCGNFDLLTECRLIQRASTRVGSARKGYLFQASGI